MGFRMPESHAGIVWLIEGIRRSTVRTFVYIFAGFRSSRIIARPMTAKSTHNKIEGRLE
jgi:hypothetical protein